MYTIISFYIPKKISLFGFTKVTDTNMGKHLFLQNFLRIFDSFLFSDARLCPSGANEVQGNILFLDDKRFVQRRLNLLCIKRKRVNRARSVPKLIGWEASQKHRHQTQANKRTQDDKSDMSATNFSFWVSYIRKCLHCTLFYDKNQHRKSVQITISIISGSSKS